MHLKTLSLPLVFALLAPIAGGCDDGGSSGFEAVVIPDRTTGNAPLRVGFTARANGPLENQYAYRWDFGDGEVSEADEPTHTFAAPGTYTVKVTVEDLDGGGEGTSSTSIEVLPPADIQVSDMAFTPRQVRAGADIEVSFGVRNAGAQVFGGWALQIVLSEDENFDEQDIVLGEVRRADDPPSDAPAGVNLDVTLPEDLTSGDFFVGVVADAALEIGDDVRGNNVAWAPFTVQVRNPMDNGPDLSSCGVSIPSFDAVPLGQLPVAQLGDQIQVDACLANTGNRPLASASFQLLLSRDEVADPDDRVIGGRDNLALGQGDRESFVETVDLPTEAGAGEWYLIMVADPDDEVEEQLEDNNTRVWPGPFELVEPGDVEGVDLRITALEADSQRVYWGQQLGGRLVLENRGSEDVRRLFVVRLVVEPTDGSESIAVQSLNLQGIDAGATEEIDLAVPIGRRVDQGTYRLVAVADPTNAADDVNPGNNRRSLQDELVLGGEPDVDPGVAGVTAPAMADAGSDISVGAMVRNLGDDSTGVFQAAVVLSEDQVFDASDRTIALVNVEDLEGGAPRQLDLDAEVPLDLDQQVVAWNVGVVLDPEDRLTTERSEENNVAWAEQPMQVIGSMGGCAEDADNEENDVFGDASALAPGAYEGLGICDDADWFGVQVPAGSELDVRVSWDPAEGQPTLRLTDAEGVELATAEIVARGEARVFALAGMEERTLLLEITGSGARLQYSLQVAVNEVDPRPDFRVRAVQPQPALVMAGAAVDVDFEVINAGGGATPASEAAVFLADMAMPGEMALTTVAIPALAPAEIAPLRARIDVPEGLEDGLYFVVVQADPEGLVEERDAADNIGFAQIRIDAEQACEADDLEPNGGPHEEGGAVLQAAAIETGVTENLAACVGDDDWYAVTLQADERLDVIIDFDAELGDLDLQLYGLDGETILDSSVSLQPQESVTLLRAPEAGDYFIRVLLNGGGINISTAYQIDVRIQDAGACPDDLFEPNGDPGAAQLLPDGRHDLSLCPGDEDWFRFNIPAGNTVSFQLAVDNPDVRLALFDPNDELVDEDGRRIAHEADISGFHRLRVTALEAAEELVPYSVTVAGVSGVDLVAEAVSLSALEAAAGDDLRASLRISNQRGNDAEDVLVRFTLSTDEVLSADDTLLRDRIVPRVSGAQEVRIDQRFSLAPDLAAGAYFVIVEIDPESSVPDLRRGNNIASVPLAVVPSCVDDDERTNEGPRTATRIADDEPLDAVICPFTEDWYLLPAGAGEGTVLLEFDGAAGDLDLQVFDGEGAMLLGESRTEGDQELVEFEVLEAGSVLVRVDGFLDARNTYTLSWDLP